MIVKVHYRKDAGIFREDYEEITAAGDSFTKQIIDILNTGIDKIEISRATLSAALKDYYDSGYDQAMCDAATDEEPEE
ncbi:MAG: hypothetical protein IJI23_00710 [Lachnospiraceae bacterium]|nr:hypothetical protein [Lachnospiraceae bacterium]